MPDKYFMSAAGADFAGSLRDSLYTERVLWSGRCAVAEYAFDEPASLPRWTLPEETEVVVTEQRVVYRDGETGHTGDLRWPWPQHLRVQPGSRENARQPTVTQIQLVCAGPMDTFPALVFAGGDLTAVGDADRLANVLRQAIARYRVEHAADLGLAAPQARMLSRLVIGPEFSNYAGGEGQTVSLLGAVAVGRPTAVYRAAAEVPITPMPAPARPVSAQPLSAQPVSVQSVLAQPVSAQPGAAYPSATVGWAVGERSGLSAATTPPPRADLGNLESRAADLAARVADLVSGGMHYSEAETNNLSAYLNIDSVDGPPYGAPGSEWDHGTERDRGADWERGSDWNRGAEWDRGSAGGRGAEGEHGTAGDRGTAGEPSADRAEAVRRTAARFAGNSARARGAAPQRRTEDEYRGGYR